MKVNISGEQFILIIFDGRKIINKKHEKAFEIEYMKQFIFLAQIWFGECN